MIGRRYVKQAAPSPRRVGTPPELQRQGARPPLEWYAERQRESPPPALASLRSEVIFVPVPAIVGQLAPLSQTDRIETVRAVRVWWNSPTSNTVRLTAPPPPFNTGAFKLIDGAERSGMTLVLSDTDKVPYIDALPLNRVMFTRDLYRVGQRAPIGVFLIEPMRTNLAASGIRIVNPGLGVLGLSYVVPVELFYTV